MSEKNPITFQTTEEPALQAEAVKELKTIRQIMERPVRYSTQSGLAGVIAGVSALLGTAGDYYVSMMTDWPAREQVAWCMAIWAGVLAVALTGVLITTRIREIQQSMPFWTEVKKRILRTILPPFVAGIALGLIIVWRWYTQTGANGWGLIAPSWMILYGLTCWQVSEFSIRELRWMGVAFLLWGLISAALFQNKPYLAFGVSFGGFHLVYGLWVWIRYGG